MIREEKIINTVSIFNNSTVYNKSPKIRNKQNKQARKKFRLKIDGNTVNM